MFWMYIDEDKTNTIKRGVARIGDASRDLHNHPEFLLLKEKCMML